VAESLTSKGKNHFETQTRNLNCQSRFAKEIQADERRDSVTI